MKSITEINSSSNSSYITDSNNLQVNDKIIKN